MQSELSFFFGDVPAVYSAHSLYDRTLPTSGEAPPSGEYDSLNLIVVVAGAVLIAFLAQWLSRRGRRK